MLQNGNDVYYSKWDGILYKTEVGKDDNDRTEIYRSANGNHIGYINISGDILYFYEAGTGVCRTSTDGTGFMVIESFPEITERWGEYNSNFSCQEMILLGNTLFVNFNMSYFSASNSESDDFRSLYRINKDTGTKQLISRDDEEIKWITAYNDYLYVVVSDDFNDGSVMKIAPDSMEKETVAANLRATSILLDDNYIYFFRFADAYIYRAKHDGSGVEKISVDCGDTYFTMDSKCVYYRYGWGVYGDNKICAYNKETLENIEFISGDINDSFGLYIIGDHIYYINGRALTKERIYSNATEQQTSENSQNNISVNTTQFSGLISQVKGNADCVVYYQQHRAVVLGGPSQYFSVFLFYPTGIVEHASGGGASSSKEDQNAGVESIIKFVNGKYEKNYPSLEERPVYGHGAYTYNEEKRQLHFQLEGYVVDPYSEVCTATIESDGTLTFTYDSNNEYYTNSGEQYTPRGIYKDGKFTPFD